MRQRAGADAAARRPGIRQPDLRYLGPEQPRPTLRGRAQRNHPPAGKRSSSPTSWAPAARASRGCSRSPSPPTSPAAAFSSPHSGGRRGQPPRRRNAVDSTALFLTPRNLLTHTPKTTTTTAGASDRLQGQPLHFHGDGGDNDEEESAPRSRKPAWQDPPPNTLDPQGRGRIPNSGRQPFRRATRERKRRIAARAAKTFQRRHLDRGTSARPARGGRLRFRPGTRWRRQGAGTAGRASLRNGSPRAPAARPPRPSSTPSSDYANPQPGYAAVMGGYIAGLGDTFGRYIYGDYCARDVRSFSPAAPAATDGYEGVASLNSFGEYLRPPLRRFRVRPGHRLVGGESYCWRHSRRPQQSFLGLRALRRKVKRNKRAFITRLRLALRCRRGQPVSLRGRPTADRHPTAPTGLLGTVQAADQASGPLSGEPRGVRRHLCRSGLAAPEGPHPAPAPLAAAVVSSFPTKRPSWVRTSFDHEISSFREAPVWPTFDARIEKVRCVWMRTNSPATPCDILPWLLLWSPGALAPPRPTADDRSRQRADAARPARVPGGATSLGRWIGRSPSRSRRSKSAPQPASRDRCVASTRERSSKNSTSPT